MFKNYKTYQKPTDGALGTERTLAGRFDAVSFAILHGVTTLYIYSIN